MYTTIRELVENSLDSVESTGVLPDVYLRLRDMEGFYEVLAKDNGSGVPPDKIPQAFGQVLFGSKYRLRQTRGTFGLGGKMAILYGQITTNRPVRIISSTGGSKIHEFLLSINIKLNKPKIQKHKVMSNPKRWHGTMVYLNTKGDYPRIQSKILEYLRQTATAAPYATITFVGPDGCFYRFERNTKEMPPPPKEVRPHPAGMDVEGVNRIVAVTKTSSMVDFLQKHFQRVGEKTSRRFLQYVGIDPRRNPKKLTPDEVVKLCSAMHDFRFIAPDASCLSPLEEDLFTAGIRKGYAPEFLSVVQRAPSAYSGFPFIVEVAIGYGGALPQSDRIPLYRFANRIPLLFDEGSDVSRKVIDEKIDWRQYKVPSQSSIAVFVHICSTKIPYKTVGKEMISDRPEIEREITIALREAGRRLMRYLLKRERRRVREQHLQVFEKYLPKIARFAAKLAGREKAPDIKPLLRIISRQLPTSKECGLVPEVEPDSSKNTSRQRGG
jgi:DNA topoisomerase-6 subunit B